MIILNATRTVKSIMTDNGSLISIEPGGQSEMIIATKNVILAAINMGTPAEVGIIVSGSYEMDVIKNISGAIPYLYTDLQEAKAKLIDPSINYKASLEVKNADAKFQKTLEEKDQKIKVLESEVVDLKSQVEKLKSTDLVDSLEASLNKANADKEQLIKEKARLQANIDDMSDQIKNNTENLNTLRKSNGQKDQDLSIKDTLINQLNEELTNLKKDFEANKNSSEELKKVEEDLKKQLAESVDTIENMKKTFNGACQKFGLYLDDQGEWQMQQ